MKKSISIFIIILLLLGLIPALSFAVEKSSDIKVQLNGEQLVFDVPPTIIDGRTMVPLRSIFEALGAEVNWDESTKTITATIANTKIKLTIDNSTAYFNDKSVSIDVAPTIINGRTMVPLRFIGESFGADITWNNSTSTVSINYSTPDVKKSNTNIDSFKFCTTNRSYVSSDNGLTVVVKKIEVNNKSGYKEYTISYSEENKTRDKVIDQGTFKVYFKDGTSQPQYGFFNKLYPGDKEDRVFTFKCLNDTKPLLIEYGSEQFFKEEPTSETLKWKL